MIRGRLALSGWTQCRGHHGRACCRSLTRSSPTPPVRRVQASRRGGDASSRYDYRVLLSHAFIVHELGASVFSGYNVLGDGTPQALLPLLTGRTETELPEARRGFEGATTVDDHPWIWRQLKDAGYVTQWAEDSAEIGTYVLTPEHMNGAEIGAER